MESIKTKIEKSLEDEFLSKEESRDIINSFRQEYFSPKERVELIKYATRLASERANPENQQFVFKWFQQLCNVLGDFGTDELHNNAFFSHTDDIRSKVIRTIKNGSGNIDICLFTISDNKITDAILNAKNQGLKVRVITDDEKMMDKGYDIFRLKHRGITVKIDSYKSLMHHKFAIIDDHKVISGSYNWTRSGSEINNENIIITDNHRIVTAFGNEFKRLWQQMKKL